MKVSGTGGPNAAGAARGARPGAAGGGFKLPSVSGAAGPAQASGVGSVAGVMGVEALLALQDVGGPLERRRRAVRRADRILDVLDEVKVALLGGDLSGAELDRLQRAIREERTNTDDPRLEAVLDEIEVRAAVEIAKLEHGARAA
ncbi:flagellar assembly protein FliX [Phenylobacterium deserti]|uniref:Flagellar assembly protein FliX n=1 Tax=Phenylobacterium deserti TaxID=1914756 RepID=A0A328AHK4_9CAUL|nr:flagellar assembly protein FliX [Phenylobacterium deserti]RAK52338.1 flagellar assembly protein FliX [Phenylobacterium deserti]